VSFYEKGPVRIHFEEKGSGFPLLMIAGGGLNSAIPNLSAPYSPFNAMDEFKYEYRCIGADLRNANDGQSTGPLEIDRPWDSYTDDHLDLMDHLRIDKFMVLGFCIGPKSMAKSKRTGHPSRGYAGRGPAPPIIPAGGQGRKRRLTKIDATAQR
jgi:pimeloyl-ACP methyl ester carboxylesterase